MFLFILRPCDKRIHFMKYVKLCKKNIEYSNGKKSKKCKRSNQVISAKPGLNAGNYSLEKDTGGVKVLCASSGCLLRINVQKKSVSLF